MQSAVKVLMVVDFRKADPFNISGVAYHRLVIPYINLAKKYPVEVHQINEIDSKNIDLKDFQLVVFSRVLSNYGRDEEVLAALQKARIPFIVDVDDFWRLPPTHLVKLHWDHYRMPRRVKMALKHATVVTTTTSHLAAQVKCINKNVYVLPNAIDPEQPQFIPRPVPSGQVRVGWVGGICHTDDIPLLEKGFQQLYADEPLYSKYKVKLGGFNPVNLDVWAYYEHIFTAGKSRPHYERLPAMDIRQYATMYNQLDVCLVPLEDTPFNRCKSPLKLLEAGWFKKACVVSELYPYTVMGRHRENVLFVKNNKTDWYKHVKKLIQNPALREDLGNSLYETVKQDYVIDKVNERRWEVVERAAR